MSEEQEEDIDSYRIENLADRLTNEIDKFVDEFHVDQVSVVISEAELLMALVDCIASVVSGISCAGCRKVKARAVKDHLRDALKFVLANPIPQEGGEEEPQHVH
jgi:hypothetical protein